MNKAKNLAIDVVCFLMMALLVAIGMYAFIMPDPAFEERGRKYAAEAAERDAFYAREEIRNCLHRELARWNYEPTDEQYEMAEARCNEVVK